ncbi:MAG: MAPEG family protein [Pseudomonadota bacterium]
MTDYSLIYPMLALVLLTFGVAVVLFRARVRSIREGHTPVTYFRTFQGSLEPEYLAKPTRHFVNLFEVPTLFYAGCLAAMVSGVTGVVMVALAWGYVAARLAHAVIHIRGNRVRKRLAAYAASWLFLLGLWLVLGVSVATRL